MEANEIITPNQSVHSNNNQSRDTDIANLVFDLERISLGEHLFDTVKCSLCYLISGSPLILKCCENIICTSCTNSWMQKNNHNCPICRRILNIQNRIDSKKYFPFN